MASHDIHGFLIMGEPCADCSYEKVGNRQRRISICPEHKKLQRERGNWSSDFTRPVGTNEVH
jgi:hypothetical protein